MEQIPSRVFFALGFAYTAIEVHQKYLMEESGMWMNARKVSD